MTDGFAIIWRSDNYACILFFAEFIWFFNTDFSQAILTGFIIHLLLISCGSTIILSLQTIVLIRIALGIYSTAPTTLSAWGFCCAKVWLLKETWCGTNAPNRAMPIRSYGPSTRIWYTQMTYSCCLRKVTLSNETLTGRGLITKHWTLIKLLWEGWLAHVRGFLGPINCTG